MKVLESMFREISIIAPKLEAKYLLLFGNRALGELMGNFATSRAGMDFFE